MPDTSGRAPTKSHPGGLLDPADDCPGEIWALDLEAQLTELWSFGSCEQVVGVTLSEIRVKLEHIAGQWRSATSAERREDLSDLDALLGVLDEVETDHAAAVESAEELRGRIEILMDEIEISLGMEPTPITGYADFDTDTRL